LDESSLGLALVERLKQKGMTVTIAQAGSEWQAVGDGQYLLDPRRLEHYEQLFGELVNAGKTPGIIVHLWSLTKTSEQASGPEYFDQMQLLGFNSLVYLTQALSKQTILKPVHIEVLSNGLYTLEGPVQPEKATILGPSRVIPQELPSITCRYVDIFMPPQGTWQETGLVNQLVTQVLKEPSNGTFVLRDEQCWEQSFEALQLPDKTDGIGLLREKGVYLITGGLGYVGLMVAEHLAKQVRARLVLTGRSVFPPREEWEQRLSAQDAVSHKIRRILAMEELGAEVILLDADVADPKAMQAIIADIDRRWGNLHGVFHLAGLVNDMNPVQELTAQQSESHFRPKVYGLFCLEQVLRGRQLDFCLLFSSLASVLGGLGFGAYSAANNFMDAWARKQNQQGLVRWISVNWDGWQANQKQQGKNTFGNTIGELSMASEESMSALQLILSRDQVNNQIVVSTANLQARINQWVKLESLRDQERGNRAETIVLQTRPALQSAYVAPRNQTEQTLVSIWQELLGIEQIGVHDNFFELGGHSLLATQVISKIRAASQINLPLRILFESPSIEMLAIEIEKEIQGLEDVEV